MTSDTIRSRSNQAPLKPSEARVTNSPSKIRGGQGALKNVGTINARIMIESSDAMHRVPTLTTADQNDSANSRDAMHRVRTLTTADQNDGAHSRDAMIASAPSQRQIKMTVHTVGTRCIASAQATACFNHRDLLHACPNFLHCFFSTQRRRDTEFFKFLYGGDRVPWHFFCFPPISNLFFFLFPKLSGF